MIRKWIVVLNYNVATHCVRLLDALWPLDDIGMFLVDNGSAPADYAILRDACVQRQALLVEDERGRNDGEITSRLASGATLALCRNPRNLGYSGGNNTAMRMLDPLLGESGEYLIVNPDVFITEATARALLDCDAELCGPAIYEHWSGQVATAGLCVDFGTGFPSKMPVDYPGVSTLHGSCLKLSGRALRKYGFLPDENFLYEEEMKYFERVHRLGGNPVYLRDLQVEHIGKASTVKLSYRYFYYIFRNRLCYFLEIAGPHYRRYGKFALLYLEWTWDVVRSQARKRNWAGIRGQIRGIRDGFRRVKGPMPGDVQE